MSDEEALVGRDRNGDRNGDRAPPMATAVSVEKNESSLDQTHVFVFVVVVWWFGWAVFASSVRAAASSTAGVDELVDPSSWAARAFFRGLLMTWFGLSTCVSFEKVLVLWRSLRKARDRGEVVSRVVSGGRALLVRGRNASAPGALHALGHVFTVACVVFAPSAAALGWRATEPLVVVAASFAASVGRDARTVACAAACAAGTLWAVGGAFGGDEATTTSLSFGAVLGVLAANVSYALRNVTLKHRQRSDGYVFAGSLADGTDDLGACSVAGFFVTTVALVLAWVVLPTAATANGPRFLFLCGPASVLFLLCDQLSFAVLTHTDAVAHSVLRSGPVVVWCALNDTSLRVWTGLAVVVACCVLAYDGCRTSSSSSSSSNATSSTMSKTVALLLACVLSVVVLEGRDIAITFSVTSLLPTSYLPDSLTAVVTDVSPVDVATTTDTVVGTDDLSSARLKTALMRDGRSTCLQKIRRLQFNTLSDVFNVEPVHRWSHKALLVDGSYHANVGDSLITLGEKEFLTNLGYNRDNATRLYECGVAQGREHSPLCHTMEQLEPFREVRLAIWQGGGNWGNLWPRVHQARLETFGNLLRSGKTIVAMPSSLYYEEDGGPTEEMDNLKMRNEIASGLGMADVAELETPEGRALAKSRVVLTWRERESYDAALTVYPFASHRLVPEMAFQLGPFLSSLHSDPRSPVPNHNPGSEQYQVRPRRVPDKVDLLLFVRNDFESPTAATSAEETKDDHGRRSEHHWRRHLDSIGATDVTFAIHDWTDRTRVLRVEDHLFGQTAVDLVGMGRVVVADRLHATVLAFSSNVPLVFVDQRTKKISGTMDVAMNAWPGCRDQERLMYGSAETLEDGVDEALRMLKDNRLRELPDV